MRLGALRRLVAGGTDGVDKTGWFVAWVAVRRRAASGVEGRL